MHFYNFEGYPLVFIAMSVFECVDVERVGERNELQLSSLTDGAKQCKINNNVLQTES